jgi:putative hemolysin
MDIATVGKLLFLIILLGLSSFFSASETALMALSRLRVRHMLEQKIKGAGLVYVLLQNPNKLLSAILVGNNAINIGASAIATSLALKFFPDKGVLISTVTMTLLVLIFGEITPKSIAARNSEKVSLKIAKPISFIVNLLGPVVTILTRVTNIFIKLLGGKIDKEKPFITEEELKTIVDVSHEEGVLEVEEKQMIQNVFEFGDLLIKDVMIQRTDIVAIEADLSYNKTIEIIKLEQFSRYPVYKSKIDDIVGILNVKDIVFVENIKEDFNITEYMRKPYFTFEFNRLTELFKEMKKTRNHMAIVLDEYGGTAGIVTIEDLIEEIVGDIKDEYDELENEIEVMNEKEYLVYGSTRMHLISELLGIKMVSEDFDSIGGFIIGELGRIPKPGEIVEYNRVKFIVENVDKNRIKKIRILID